MKPLCVIWDWNGTLLDDLQLCLGLLNELLEQNGSPNRYDLAAYREIFGFPVVDYYRRAGFDFEARSFEALAADYVARYDPASFACSLCPGAADALAALRSAGVRQVILSASEQTLLNAQAGHLGVAGYFDELLGQADHYAHGKLAVGKAWMARQSFDPAQAVLVGDTLHDAQVAAGLGTKCVLCAAGHQSRERLLAAGAPVIGTLKELPALLGL
ncbi:MAG TPA: HAD hydrolase-like protein [Candidatus Fournierella excrementigallinarum]|nr:HAD hydrolase-like protein [Candidatus Fournierella excrementigallinarum]